MRPPAGSGSCFRLTKRVRFAHSHRRPPATLLALRSNLAEGFAPATANASLSAVRGSLKLAWLSGDLSQDNYARRMESLKNVQGKSAPGRALNAVEVGKLFAAAASGNSPAASARDAALLAMLYGLGLRRAEADRRRLAFGEGDKSHRTLAEQDAAWEDLPGVEIVARTATTQDGKQGWLIVPRDAARRIKGDG